VVAVWAGLVTLDQQLPAVARLLLVQEQRERQTQAAAVVLVLVLAALAVPA
jgi:hypothetical protein